MDILANFREMSRKLQKTIVLPEGSDPRTIEAAATIIREKIAKLIILGDKDAITKQLGTSDSYTAINPLTDPRLANFISEYYEMRKDKGLTMEEATVSMKNPLFFGAMLVRIGDADGCVAGAANTTGDVLRSGLRLIGVKKGMKTVSSCFIMVTNKKELGNNGVFLFGDCAVNPDPDENMLADIAIATAENYKKLLHATPVVAMLSFSTMGSADTPNTQKVANAVKLVKQRMPDLQVDGEMQLDAAIIPSVGTRKAPGSAIAGKANVLIFPNLESGNIGYKLTERFGNAQAIGPLIQGFAKPVNDLSRGCNADDIVNTVAATSVQAGE